LRLFKTDDSPGESWNGTINTIRRLWQRISKAHRQ
jgi:hypothetical protein